MRPDDILPTYESVARGYAKSRNKSLFERRWLDRALACTTGRDVLDIGCGSGNPIARYLSDRNAVVTGLDGSAAMLALFRETLPRAETVLADMRTMALQRRFDILIAWNSFFHLSPDEQRTMFPIFAQHTRPEGILMFTSGPEAGEVLGAVEGKSVYHSSLDPQEYRQLLRRNAFGVIDFVANDPDCAGHSVWLARKAAIA